MWKLGDTDRLGQLRGLLNSIDSGLLPSAMMNLYFLSGTVDIVLQKNEFREVKLDLVFRRLSLGAKESERKSYCNVEQVSVALLCF